MQLGSQAYRDLQDYQDNRTCTALHSLVAPRGPADDGKRLDLYGPRWTLHTECRRQLPQEHLLYDYILIQRGESEGGENAVGLGWTGGLADDGKRLGLSEPTRDVA